ncbi:hypothetical protein Pmani_002419 [Petrolisthes manimaculis]|uniref:Ion transport domain-containing protein n=1 Tax=Petrolisthes manimaculis TaxID=1843537 RepID=A0AAE1UJD9_9EUCA|nr:hypothetical protein Pmani_002419 [Petrolisthes manimaculis]
MMFSREGNCRYPLGYNIWGLSKAEGRQHYIKFVLCLVKLTGFLDTEEVEQCSPIWGTIYFILTTLVLVYFLTNIIFEIVLGAIGSSRNRTLLSRLREAADREQG